jgi:hypothetical protein
MRVYEERIALRADLAAANARVKELEKFIEKRLEHCVSDQRGAYQDVLDALRGLKGRG